MGEYLPSSGPEQLVEQPRAMGTGGTTTGDTDGTAASAGGRKLRHFRQHHHHSNQHLRRWRVLRGILREYNDLSWLTVNPVSALRESMQALHIDMALRLARRLCLSLSPGMEGG